MIDVAVGTPYAILNYTTGSVILRSTYYPFKFTISSTHTIMLITSNTMNQIQLKNYNIYSNNKTNLVIKIFDKTCYMFEENQFDICMQRYVGTTRGKKPYNHMVKIINMIVSSF